MPQVAIICVYAWVEEPKIEIVCDSFFDKISMEAELIAAVLTAVNAAASNINSTIPVLASASVKTPFIDGMPSFLFCSQTPTYLQATLFNLSENTGIKRYVAFKTFVFICILCGTVTLSLLKSKRECLAISTSCL